MSQMLAAAAEIAQNYPEDSEAPSTPETRSRKPPKKVTSSNVKEVKMEEASKTESLKYPTAIRMQNKEGFAVNLE